MRQPQTYTEKSFRKGILIVLFITIALLSIILGGSKSSNTSALLIGLPIFIAGILGIIGSTQAIKGLKEKKTAKMAFAILINFGIVLIFFGLLAANMVDIYRTFK